MNEKGIRELIWEIINDRFVWQTAATVTAVDRESQSCTVQAGDAPEQYSARLAAVIDTKDSYVIAWPKVGSIVIVGALMNNANAPVIVQVSEVDEVEVKSPKVTIDSDEVVINGGTKGGIIEIEKLKAEIAKNTALIKSLRSALLNWVPVPSDGGAALKTFATASGMAALSTADLSQITNEKVKHG